MRKHLSTVIVILALVIGLSLILYPIASDVLNNINHKRAINSYISKVHEIEPETCNDIIEKAKQYNENLSNSHPILQNLTEEELKEYESLLDITGTGIMGYIDIPIIDVHLPIYHGADESVLQVGVGHIEGSSLPVGGESTHSVLSGHRGLPSATLFTNIDRLVEGDVFMIYVLNETYTYEVDNIQVIEPQNTNPLQIEEGEDYCTLFTCTPYGINTHRLLVRGHRIENLPEGTVVMGTGRSEAANVSALSVILFAEIPIMLLTVIIVILRYRKKR